MLTEYHASVLVLHAIGLLLINIDLIIDTSFLLGKLSIAPLKISHVHQHSLQYVKKHFTLLIVNNFLPNSWRTFKFWYYIAEECTISRV